MATGGFAEHGVVAGGALRRLPAAADVARALLAIAACIVLTPLVKDELSDHANPFDALAVVLTVVGCAPIAFRRMAPVVAAVAGLSTALLGVALDRPMTGPIIVALGLVGLATCRADVRMTGTLGVFSGAVIAAIAGLGEEGDPLLLALISGVAVGMLPALVGERLRAERMRTEDAQELARRVEELRDRDVGRAVAEERLRIARDVHDITGHHLSAISLQSAGAGRTTDDPVARAAFERIHGLTAQALGQTRRSLGVLRSDAEPAALVPLPRLAHVEHLLGPARVAGIDVDLRVEGRVREVSETVELCAYRVVQESLTNVVRHAGARSVRVVIAYGEDVLTVAVQDDGSGDDGRPLRAGSGVEGMRDRVALVGGSLTAGPRDEGGWSVHAALPLEDRR
jgi:signal transduction histidine kinase